MTSDGSVDGARTAFVWIWLPGHVEPVVCGRLDRDGQQHAFTYGRSYLERGDAVAVYEPELPLEPGTRRPDDGRSLPLCIDDAMPDSWGRRLVNHRHGTPTAELSDLTYLLESGSDRIGALDFQLSATDYVARRADHPPLDQLAEAASRIESGQALDPDLEAALLQGTSIGGARPKAMLDDGGTPVIAKFSSSTDTYPVVQGELVAMRLAALAGIDAAPVRLVRPAGRHALVVERFDRNRDGGRTRVVSALTVLGLSPYPEGRYATYVDLADAIRSDFVEPSQTLRELFARISFNVLCGNTDDHGRNHAALVRPDGLSLSPAYDICPQARTGRAAEQAMAYGADGQRAARIDDLVAAADVYLLDHGEAVAIIDHQIDTITGHWDDVCDEAELTTAQRQAFMGTQFLNPSVRD